MSVPPSPATRRSARVRAVSALPEPLVEAMRRARTLVRAGIGWVRRPEMPPWPDVPATPVRLFVGPANFAGQGTAWAQAAERHLEPVGARSMAVNGGTYEFPVDLAVSRKAYTNFYWQERLRRYLTSSFSHVLLEAGRPVIGTRFGSTSAGDVTVLRKAGVSAALVAHGSDVRLPSRHVETHPWSPFRERDDLVIRLEAQARRAGDLFADFDGPTFVSTPDLLADVPGATWLPVVVEVDRWAAGSAGRPLFAGPRPVVLHAPSNPRFKGTSYVDEAMRELEARGLIEYRTISGVPPEEMPARMAEADIVLEQFVLGPYSVTACEAMAAGRVAVANVDADVRAHVLAATGYDLPVVQADPATLVGVVEQLVVDPDTAHGIARQGEPFVRAVHDGRMSAATLRPWLTETD